MKAIVGLLFVISTASLAHVPQNRIHLPEENDPEFKRYIYLETNDGKLELVDLMAGDPSPRVSVSDVSFDLYTLQNKDSPYTITNANVGELSRTHFSPNKVCMFVVHGWNNNRNSAVNTHIRAAAMANHDINLFIVDWSGPANKNYISAKGATEEVGKIVGNFITGIQDSYGVSSSNLVLVGHSLGAHVMGNAGAAMRQKPGSIVGLDPAGPLFTVGNTGNRLDETDGAFVQVIHTNGAMLGFSSSIGDADYYPNGGMKQTGCGWDVTGTCSHGRAYEYFAESLTRGTVFQALLCSSYDNYSNGRCNSNRKSGMGTLKIDTGAAGDFFLNTNENSPYGQS